jgi:hypothetical protein
LPVHDFVERLRLVRKDAIVVFFVIPTIRRRTERPYKLRQKRRDASPHFLARTAR